VWDTSSRTFIRRCVLEPKASSSTFPVTFITILDSFRTGRIIKYNTLPYRSIWDCEGRPGLKAVIFWNIFQIRTLTAVIKRLLTRKPITALSAIKCRISSVCFDSFIDCFSEKNITAIFSEKFRRDNNFSSRASAVKKNR